MPKKQTYKQMMAAILKSKVIKSKENTKIKESTGGGVPVKVIKI